MDSIVIRTVDIKRSPARIELLVIDHFYDVKTLVDCYFKYFV